MLQVPSSKSNLTEQVIGRDALPGVIPAWEDLCRRSVEPNVYYSPRYATALLAHVAVDEDVKLAVVWDRDKLVGALPFKRPKISIPLICASGQAWKSEYTFSCTPLLDGLYRHQAADGLLEALTSSSQGEWIIPTVNTQGESCQALVAALERRGQPWDFINRFERASFKCVGSFDEHMNGFVSPKRRKDLSRKRRRLAEQGKVEHVTHSSGQGLERAITAFLEVEASGWKGRRGTAIACDERTRAFALDAFTDKKGGSICRADLLTLDSVPIAVSLIVIAGRTGFAVKCAYDERYQSYSPGLLLEVEIIRSFLSERWLDLLDGATAGAHVIDNLWPDRREVGDLIFSLARRNPVQRLSGLTSIHKIKRSAKDTIKAALSRARHTLAQNGFRRRATEVHGSLKVS